MKKIKLLFILLMISIVALSGCSLFGPDKSLGDANEVVKEAFKNVYSLKTYSYDLSMQGNADSGGEKINFDISMSGVQDVTDIKNPKFTLRAVGSGSAPGYKKEEIDAEMRLNDNVMYFVLNNMSDFGGMVPSSMVESYLDQWYSMALPEGTFDQYHIFTYGNDENLTPKEKAMKELLENTSFFKDIEYIGNEKGRQVYNAVLDEDALIEFVKEASKIEKQALSDADISDLEKGLKNITLTAKIGIEPDKKVISMITGSLGVESLEDGSAGSFDFELYIDDIDEAVTIEVPASAVEFDPMMLFGAAMMMGGGAGTYGDMGTYEDMGMMDLDIPDTTGGGITR